MQEQRSDLLVLVPNVNTHARRLLWEPIKTNQKTRRVSYMFALGREAAARA